MTSRGYGIILVSCMLLPACQSADRTDAAGRPGRLPRYPVSLYTQLPSDSAEPFFISETHSADWLGGNRVAFLDALTARLVVADTDGHFIRAMGRQGQGPGEFLIRLDSMGRAMIATWNDTIIVADNIRRRMVLYASDGTFLREWRLNEHVSDLAVSSEGRIIVSTGDGEAPLRVYSLSGKLEQTLGAQLVSAHPWVSTAQRQYLALLDDGTINLVSIFWPIITTIREGEAPVSTWFSWMDILPVHALSKQGVDFIAQAEERAKANPPEKLAALLDRLADPLDVYKHTPGELLFRCTGMENRILLHLNSFLGYIEPGTGAAGLLGVMDYASGGEEAMTGGPPLSSIAYRNGMLLITVPGGASFGVVPLGNHP